MKVSKLGLQSDLFLNEPNNAGIDKCARNLNPCNKHEKISKSRGSCSWCRVKCLAHTCSSLGKKLIDVKTNNNFV